MSHQPDEKTPSPKAPPPGFPGYRNRPGRSGLDYMDTARENAFMEGLFIRRLFTGRLRTRNRLYLGAMLFFGLVILFTGLALLLEINPLRTRDLSIISLVLCFAVPAILIGAMLLYNFIQSVRPGGWKSSAKAAEGDAEDLSQPRHPRIRRKIRYRNH